MVRIPVELVRAWLRQAFARWGLPERLRVDNGWPWGSSGDLPTPLALWLWGLDIGVIWNPCRRPQRNGRVERYHGLIDQWGEPDRCPDWNTWEERVAWLIRTQREAYPAVAGKSRLAANPELLQNKRGYGPETEASWDEVRVYTRLARGLWRRRVGSKGQITIYNWAYSAGCRHRGEEVYVRFDPSAVAWVIQDRSANELRRYPAPELTRERVLSLDVAYIRAHKKQKQQASEIPNLIAYMVT